MRLFQPEEKFSNYYQIELCIDTEGKGAVYKARNTRLGNEIALKIFNPVLFPDREAYGLFEEKAQAFARLNHPNIARFFHYGTFEEMPFVAMEFIPGQPLYQYLQTSAPLPTKTALRLTVQICTALQYAQKFRPDNRDQDSSVALSYAHQDLRPSNIMIIPPARQTDEPIVRLTDFGFSVHGAVDQLPLNEQWLRYLPAELSKNESVERPIADELSNLYTIGQLLFDMLAGKSISDHVFSNRFNGSSESDVSSISTAVELPLVDSHPSEIGQEINGIIQKCTKDQPTERFESLADLQAGLGRIQESIKYIEDGRTFQQQQKYKSAIGSWEKVLSYLPDNQLIQDLKRKSEIEQQIERAEKQTVIGDFESAIQSWQRVLDLCPSGGGSSLAEDPYFHRSTGEIGRLKLQAQIEPLQQEIQAQKEQIRQMSESQLQIDTERDNFARDLLSRDQNQDRLQVDLSVAEEAKKQAIQEGQEKVSQLIADNQQQTADLKTQISGKNEQIEELSQQTEDLTTQCQELTDNLEKLSAEKQALQETVLEKETEFDQQATKITRLTAQVKDLDQRQANQAETIQQQATNLEQTQKSLAEIETLATEIDQEKSNLETHLADLNQEQTELTANLQQVQQERDELQKEVADQYDQLNQGKRELEDLSKHQKQMKVDLVETEGKVKNLDQVNRDQAEQIRQQEDTAQQAAETQLEFQATISSQQQQVESLQEELSTQSDEITEKTKKLEQLEKRKEKGDQTHRRVAQELQEQLEHFQQENEQLLREHIQAETENIGLQVEWESVQKEIDGLTQQLVANTDLLVGKEQQIQQFVQEKQHIDTQIEELEQRFRSQTEALVAQGNLNQELLQVQEATAVEQQDLQDQLLQLQEYNSAKETELQQQQQQVEELEQSKLEVESNLQTTSADLDHLRQKWQQQEQSSMLEKNNFEQVLNESKLQNQQLIDTLEHQVSSLKTQIVEKDTQLQNLIDASATGNNATNLLQQQYYELEAQLEDKNQQLADFGIGASAEHVAMAEQLQNLTVEKSTAAAQAEGLQLQVSELEAECRRLQDLNQELEVTTSDQVQQVLDQGNQQQERIKSEIEQYKEGLQQRDDEIQTLTNQKEELETQVTEQKQMLKSAAIKFKHQRQQIKSLSSGNTDSQTSTAAPQAPASMPSSPPSNTNQLQIPKRTTANEYVDLGISYRKEGKYQEAIVAYQEAIKLNPSHEWAYNNIGYAYYCDQQYEKSVAAYKKAIQVKPDHGWAYNGLGRAYNQLGDYQQATEAFLASTQVAPDNAEAFYNLAKAYMVSKEENLVLSYLKQAITQDPAYAIAAQDEQAFAELVENPKFKQLVSPSE